jgi:hypothetical protein
MCRGRRGDDDRLDVAEGERVGERGARVRDAAPCGAPGRLLQFAADESDNVEAGVLECGYVHPGAESRPDNDSPHPRTSSMMGFDDLRFDDLRLAEPGGWCGSARRRGTSAG